MTTNACRIVSIREDDDEALSGRDDPDLYEVLDQVEDLFRRVDVRPDSNEQAFEACLAPDGTVLGASVCGLYSVSPDDSDPLRRPRFSFSVAVDELHRRKGIARALIESLLAAHPRDEVLLEGKVVNPHMVGLLKSMGFVYTHEPDDDEFTDLDRQIGRRMYRPNSRPRKLDVEGDPEVMRRHLIRLADKKIMEHRRSGRFPLATAEDAAQAAMLADLEAIRGGRKPTQDRYRAMDEEIARSASVAETPLPVLKESLAATEAIYDDDVADELWLYRRADTNRRRGEKALMAYRRTGLGGRDRALTSRDEERDALASDLLMKVLRTLPYREREIIKLRYGLSDGYTYTLEEIGRIFGISMDRVRQIEVSGIQRLQHPIMRRMLRDAVDLPRETDVE